MNKYIASDLYRYYGKVDYITLLKALVKSRIFRFQFMFRLASDRRKIVRMVGRILWYLNPTRHHVVLSPDTRVGYGLYIGHGGPIVVNSSAVIGDNCNLSQYVTIGANDGEAAVIGDNVYIGPNVCIVEHMKIGNNTTIGAGSVVTKDIPDNATAVGNYAKVIHYDNPGRYINHPYNAEK